jgi:hypothetical protein
MYNNLRRKQFPLEIFDIIFKFRIKKKVSYMEVADLLQFDFYWGFIRR